MKLDLKVSWKKMCPLLLEGQRQKMETENQCFSILFIKLSHSLYIFDLDLFKYVVFETCDILQSSNKLVTALWWTNFIGETFCDISPQPLVHQHTVKANINIKYTRISQSFTSYFVRTGWKSLLKLGLDTERKLRGTGGARRCVCFTCLTRTNRCSRSSSVLSRSVAKTALFLRVLAV